MSAYLMVGSPERAVNLTQIKTAKVDLQGVAHLTLVGEGADQFISFRIGTEVSPSSRVLAQALVNATMKGGVITCEDFISDYEAIGRRGSA